MTRDVGRTIARALPLLLILGTRITPATAQETTPEQVEFFEKKVRPLLAEHCYKCHSTEANKPKAGLLLDSRTGLLKGGDNGPALVPGAPVKSRLIEAIHYKNPDLQMPPRAKLPDAAIADLSAWVKMGAPWPKEIAPKVAGGKYDFDLSKRKSAHWSWQPIRPQTPPAVKDTAWARSPVDRFLLARLEDKGLKPAAQADPRTLLRRLYFDLIGLPPTPEEVAAFEQSTGRNPQTAIEEVVDRLLASPHFGERWGRHWLDLVRYAESRGHEFDYNLPDAYQYRDYVIRALNADVPYNQFVTEHLAGDLLKNPRLHPTEHFNESLLGTGFWFLGEQVHSPVDICQDKADRVDNMLDVMSKTFLGLTVACARCHNHKFDAISTKDYYALCGFLESSSYRLARFDAQEQNRKVAESLWKLRTQARPAVQRALAEAVRPGLERLSEYLLAARAAMLAGPQFDAGQTVEEVFEDFESGTYAGWDVTGTAFGKGPQTLQTIAPYQGRINGVGKYFVNSHNVRDDGGVRRGDAHTGTMTSRPFTVARAYITMLVGGGAGPQTRVDLLIDGKAVLSAHGRDNNQMFPVRWDVRPYRGRGARIKIVDEGTGGWGNIGVDHIVFTDSAGTGKTTVATPSFSETYRRRLAEIAREGKLDAALLERWVAYLSAASKDSADPLHAWAKIAADPGAKEVGRLTALLRPLLEDGRKRDAAADAALKGAEIVVDYLQAGPDAWIQDGFAFGPGPVRAGELRLGDDPARPVLTFREYAAAEKDATWDRQKLAPGAENESGALGGQVGAGRTLRTPTFKVTGKVFYLVRGSGRAYASVDGHVMIAGPLHGGLVQKISAGPAFRWLSHDLRRYNGSRAHLEFTPADGSDFAVALVVQAESAPGQVELSNQALQKLLSGDAAGTLDTLAKGYQRLLTDTADRLAADRIVGTADAAAYAPLANWLLQHQELLGGTEATRKLADAAGPFVADQARLIGQIKTESRLAPALLDGSGVDEHVFIRGTYKAPGELVPRRFLEALAGAERLAVERGSGRLELARQMTDPTLNPFLPRVMVNRVWHHLFGRGIVASVDNFGVLGEAPSHPELLDYLAEGFVKDGWSVKKLIRALVLTRAYQMSSSPDARAQQMDPQNVLLQRMRMRRLEGEAIRDAILAVSGRLDRRAFGPSVPVNLTAFQEGRGRPGSGPLDGNGRRSIYLSVRRNFLPSFLLAFDTPIPFSTVGRRSVSNVPAQALILMNDPFVHSQAEVWAKRVLAQGGSPKERVTGMYQSAFSRPPTETELNACLDFLERQGQIGGNPNETAAWAALAHVLFNAKEFIFLS